MAVVRSRRVRDAGMGGLVQQPAALGARRLASGGRLAATEAQQMVSEKVAAFGEAQAAIITALAAGKSLNSAVARAYGPYRPSARQPS
jgi:hypothetical protein